MANGSSENSAIKILNENEAKAKFLNLPNSSKCVAGTPNQCEGATTMYSYLNYLKNVIVHHKTSLVLHFNFSIHIFHYIFGKCVK